jgi:hypothetical protein
MVLPRIQVAKAQETERHIEQELKELQATLANIEDARPFEDLTVRFFFFVHSKRATSSFLRFTMLVPLTRESPKPWRTWSRRANGLFQVCHVLPQDCRFSLILFAGYKEKFGDLSLL